MWHLFCYFLLLCLGKALLRDCVISSDLHLYVFNAVVSVDCSKAVSLLQIFVRESVVSYVTFVLSLSSSFVP